MSFDKCSMVAYTSAAGNRTCWTRSKSPQITLVKIVYQTFFHSSSHFHLSSPYFHYFSLIFAWNIHDTHRHTLTAADLGPCGRQFFQQRCEPRASNLWRPTWVLDRSIFFLCLGWPLEVCFMKWDVKRHGHWQQMVQQPYTSSSWWLEPEVQTFHCSKIFHSPSARNLSARPARQFLAGDLFTCPSTTIVPCETCVTCPCFSCWSPYTHHTPQKEPTLLWPQREQCRVIGVVVPARTTAIWFNRDGHKLVGKVHLFRPLGCWPNPSPQVWAPR